MITPELPDHPVWCSFCGHLFRCVAHVFSRHGLLSILQALLELVNSRRPMGTEPINVKALPKLMVAATNQAQ